MEELREKLNKMIAAGYSRTCNLIISISQMLDKEVVKAQLKEVRKGEQRHNFNSGR